MEAEAEDRAAALVENTAMSDAADSTGENVEVVERFLAAFDRRWPAEDELAELVGPDIRFTAALVAEKEHFGASRRARWFAA